MLPAELGEPVSEDAVVGRGKQNVREYRRRDAKSVLGRGSAEMIPEDKLSLIAAGRETEGGGSCIQWGRTLVHNAVSRNGYLALLGKRRISGEVAGGTTGNTENRSAGHVRNFYVCCHLSIEWNSHGCRSEDPRRSTDVERKSGHHYILTPHD